MVNIKLTLIHKSSATRHISQQALKNDDIR